MMETNMQVAVSAVQSGEMTLSEAAERFNVESNELALSLSGKQKPLTADVVEIGVNNYTTGSSHNGSLKEHKGVSKVKMLEFTEITFDELIAELGGKDKISKYWLETFKNMYKKIAGEDGKLSANELKSYFKTIEKYAGDDKMLNYTELREMLADRGEKKRDGAFVSVEPDGREQEFIMALIRLNNKKVAKKNTSIDSEGNTVVSTKSENPEVDKVVRTKDKSGRIVSECTIYKDGNKETKIFDNSGKLVKTVLEQGNEKTEIYRDESGKDVKLVYYRDGKVDKTEYRTYYENGILKTQKTVKNRYTEMEYFDKDGDLTKRIETRPYGKTVSLYKKGNWSFQPSKVMEYYSDGKLESTSTYTYKKDSGDLIKKETVYADGTKEISYGEEWRPNKVVRLDKDGNVNETEVFTYNSNGELVKGVLTKADGSKEVKYGKDWKINREESYDSNGNLRASTVRSKGKIVRNNSDGTKEIAYGDEYNPDKIENYDKDGNLVRTITVKKNKKGNVTSREETDASGNIVQTEEMFYDAKGRETIYIKKDKDGNVTRRYDSSYIGDNQRTVVRNGNDTTSLTNIVEITEHTSNGFVTVNYDNGKTVFSEEYKRGAATVYKDSNGQEITFEEYWRLSRGE